jgi:colicin import membrane protein
MRKENLERIAGLAGASGSPSSQGTAMRSSGPSASYAGRLAAIFKRNVVYPGGVETITGNPEADIQVRVSPTGDILSARLVRSSGNPSWDEAAVRAIERSERIPPDVDGRYVTDFRVTMKPKG